MATRAVFASFTERSVAQEKQLWLKAGEKMLFAGGAKGIALDPQTGLVRWRFDPHVDRTRGYAEASARTFV